MYSFKLYLFIVFYSLSLLSYHSRASYEVGVSDGYAYISWNDIEAGTPSGVQSVTNLEIDHFISGLQSRRARWGVKIYRPGAITEIKKSLANRTIYTELELIQFLKAELKGVPRVCLTAAMIGGAYTGLNYGITQLGIHLPTYFESSVPSLCLTVSGALLTPYITPAISGLTQAIFNLQTGTQAKKGSDFSRRLGMIWRATETEFSFNEQMARNTITEATILIQQLLTGISTDFGLIQQDDARSFLVERLATVFTQFLTRYPDLKPWDGDMDVQVRERLAIYANWTQQNQLEEELVTLTQERNPQLSHDRIRELVSAWTPASLKSARYVPIQD